MKNANGNGAAKPRTSRKSERERRGQQVGSDGKVMRRGQQIGRSGQSRAGAFQYRGNSRIQ